MSSLAINTALHEPISSLQITGANTPISLNTKVKKSKYFLKSYIASHLIQPKKDDSATDSLTSLTEPNQCYEIPFPRQSSNRLSITKAKTTNQSSSKQAKLPPLQFTNSFNQDKSLDINFIAREEGTPKLLKSTYFPSPTNKRKAVLSTTSYTPNPYMHSPNHKRQQQQSDQLKTIIEKCDIGIREVEGLSETIDSLKANNVSRTIKSLRRQQKKQQKEEANLFFETKSHSLNQLKKVETISAGYAFKNRSNYIEEFNYFGNGDDNDFIFNQDAQGILRKKEQKKIYVQKKKNNNEEGHHKLNDLINYCIQDKNNAMKRQICS